MQKLVECVPNISEGQDQATIDQIVAAASIEGVRILDVDAGKATNRTVITIVGEPEAVLESAFRLIKSAASLIDMRKHKGEHPRIGATDVVPFVPLQNSSMQECAELARRLGKRVADELGIPVYLYEAAATSPARQSLAFLRQGEYEGIAQKFKDPQMAPDFGKAMLNAKSGVTIIGARPFLIAYNINLNTRDKSIANQIAMRLRESGYKKKDERGKFVKDKDGNPVAEPGMFKHCRAVGWFIEEYGIAQISINFTDFTQTPIHAVFDAAIKLAEKFGLRVTGSELVGLIPKTALLQAGEHYLRKQGATTGIPESMILDTAVRSLGLGELAPFNIKDKVIEEKIMTPGKLLSLNLNKFLDSLSSDSPAPGGGSVAALAGALAASLASMVSALSYAKAKTTAQEHKKSFEEWGRVGQDLKTRLSHAIDEDTLAFEKVMQAFRIKAKSPEEKSAREKKIVEAYQLATSVPLGVAGDCVKCMELAQMVVKRGIESALSDGAVAGEAAYAGMLGASYNVRINLKELKTHTDYIDAAFISETEAKLKVLRTSADKILGEIRADIEARL